MSLLLRPWIRLSTKMSLHRAPRSQRRGRDLTQQSSQMSCNLTPDMAQRSRLDQPVIRCQPPETRAHPDQAESGRPDITLPEHPRQHLSAALLHLKATSMTHTLARSAPLSRRTSTDLMHDSSSVAVMAAVAGISPHLHPPPHCRGPRAQLRTKKMRAAIEQASLGLLDDLAAGTVLTQRPTLSHTSMITIRCPT